MFTQKTVVLIFILNLAVSRLLAQAPEEKKLELVIQTGHSSKIKNLWLSKDGKNLVSSSDDRTIIWEVNSETPLRAFEKETVKGISTDEKVILTTDEDGVYSIWEIKSGKKLYSIEEMNECVFNPGGKQVVCRNKEEGISVRNALTGEVLSEFQTPEANVTDFAFGFEDRIITSSADETTSFIRVWKDGKSASPLTGTVAWSVVDEGKMLIIVDKAKNLTVLNLVANEKTVFSEKNVEDWDVSPNGKYLLHLKTDKTVNIQELATGKVKLSRPNQDYIFSTKFSSDGKYLLFEDKKDVNVFDLENTRLQFVVPNVKLYDTEFTSDGKNVATQNGNEIMLFEMAGRKKVFTGNGGYSDKFAFSADGKKLAVENSSYEDSELALWDIETKQKLTFKSDNFVQLDRLRMPVAVMTGSDSEDGKISTYLRFDNKDDQTFSGERNLLFSTDARTLIYGDSGGRIALFDTQSGKETSSLEAHISSTSASFTETGKYLKIGNWWDFQNGGFVESQENPIDEPPSPFDKFDTDVDTKENPGLFILKDKQSKRIILEQTNVSNYSLSDDSKLLLLQKYLSSPEDKSVTAEVWDIAAKKILFKITDVLDSYDNTFVPDSQSLVVRRIPKDGVAEWDGGKIPQQRLEIWSIKGEKLFTSPENFESYQFDEKKRTLALSFKDSPKSEKKTVEVWNMVEKKLVFKLTDVLGYGPDFDMSPDGQALAVVRVPSNAVVETLSVEVPNKRLEMWSVKGEKLFASAENMEQFKFDEKWNNLVIDFEKHLEWHDFKNKSVKEFYYQEGYSLDLSFHQPVASDNGKHLAFVSNTTYNSHEFRVWNTETEKIFWRDQHLAQVNQVDFSPDDRFLISSSEDGTVKVWHLADMKLILTLIPLDEKDWVVVDTEGRFDASTNAARLMQWRFGNDLISFEQLKERYYEPNLWQKLLGFSQEPLRDVTAFKDILLPPEVEDIGADANSTVRQVRLKNKGGGIGRVQIFVNGREFIEDARDEKLKANPNLPEYTLSFDLKNAPLVAGQTPEVKAVAWNFDPNAKEKFQGYISSRGTEVVYFGKKAEPVKPPTLYAIIGGVSDYNGTQLDLRFAAKDAEDMYQAMQVGGKNLFGVEKMKLKLLATGENPQAVRPTKENFRKIFAEFAAQAEPQDILFVYLSGHGITLSFGSDTYYYLTQEAATSDKQKLSSDSVLLSSSTVSSEELTEWHKSVKALKQVLILDTCAAGALGNEFKIIEKKELSTDAKRALERMKDRVGFHVLMGSAADAVSYEASQYGQGLLTYSLLQGMKGAALQPDGQVDISKLFNYAADTVPDLAKNIGGIQRPEIRAPQGGASFAVGLLKTEADKTLIPLAKVRPLILRPVLQNQKLGYDNLKLTPLLRDRIREASFSTGRGKNTSSLVFVDAEEMPDAIIPAGNYTSEGEMVKITVNLIRNNEPVASVTAAGNKNYLPELIEQLFGKMDLVVKGLSP